MRHRRFYVTSLALDGRRLPSRGGDLIVAQRDGALVLDWELVHQTSEPVRIDPAAYEVHMSSPEGDFAGSALLVRSDGSAHVFRGAGELDGFTDELFPDDEAEDADRSENEDPPQEDGSAGLDAAGGG